MFEDIDKSIVLKLGDYDVGFIDSILNFDNSEKMEENIFFEERNSEEK